MTPRTFRERELSPRALLVYVIALPVAWLMIEVVWGATAGVLVGASIGRDPGLEEEISAFLLEAGIDSTALREGHEPWEELSPDEKRELKRM